jgi:hypothetical protein
MNLFSYWHASITIKTINVCLYQLPAPDQRRHTTAGVASGGSVVVGVGVEIRCFILRSFEFPSGSTRDGNVTGLFN